MDKEKSLGGLSKKRKALGDVSNVVGKRDFSAISGDVGGKPENRKKGRSAKLVYLGAENVEQKNCVAADGVLNNKEKGKVVLDFSESESDSPDLNKLGDYFVSEISKAPNEDDQKESSKKNFQQSRIDEVSQSVADVSRDTFVSSTAKPTSTSVLDSLDVGGSEPKDERVGSQGERSSTVSDQLGTDVADENENELGDDNLESSKFEFNDCLRFPESQESRSGLERCVGHKGDGGVSHSPVGMDLIKTCSCSFCTKAGYILSDLHYQDITGRLAALKKSRKEANILVQRSTTNNALNIHGQVKPDVERLQSNLMGQWKSLFLHVEDIYGHESNQLVANLNTLKNLRDNCKTELELINGIYSDK